MHRPTPILTERPSPAASQEAVARRMCKVERAATVLAGQTRLPDDLRRFLTSRMSDEWVIELIDKAAVLPYATWEAWVAVAATEGRNYVFAVRRSMILRQPPATPPLRLE